MLTKTISTVIIIELQLLKSIVYIQLLKIAL